MLVGPSDDSATSGMGTRDPRRGAPCKVQKQQDGEGGLCPESSSTLGCDGWASTTLCEMPLLISLGTPIVNRLEDLYSLL
jgi:hypothetical protein